MSNTGNNLPTISLVAGLLMLASLIGFNSYLVMKAEDPLMAFQELLDWCLPFVISILGFGGLVTAGRVLVRLGILKV